MNTNKLKTFATTLLTLLVGTTGFAKAMPIQAEDPGTITVSRTENEEVVDSELSAYEVVFSQTSIDQQHASTVKNGEELAVPFKDEIGLGYSVYVIYETRGDGGSLMDPIVVVTLKDGSVFQKQVSESEVDAGIADMFSFADQYIYISKNKVGVTTPVEDTTKWEEMYPEVVEAWRANQAEAIRLQKESIADYGEWMRYLILSRSPGFTDEEKAEFAQQATKYQTTYEEKMNACTAAENAATLKWKDIATKFLNDGTITSEDLEELDRYYGKKSEEETEKNVQDSAKETNSVSESTNTTVKVDAKVLGTLTIQKTFAGDVTPDKLSEQEKEEITFTVSKGDKTYTVSYDKFTDGSYTFTDLPIGEYTVTETNAVVKGYTVDTVYNVYGTKTSDQAKTTVIQDNTASGISTYVIYVPQPAFVEITNTYTRKPSGRIIVKKLEKTVDETSVIVEGNHTANGTALSSAEFELLDQDGTVLEVLTTDANGLAISENYVMEDDDGNALTYFIRETKAPEGYELDSKTYSFTFPESQRRETAPVMTFNAYNAKKPTETPKPSEPPKEEKKTPKKSTTPVPNTADTGK